MLLPQPPQVFFTQGFEALFSRTGALCYLVCFTPLLFLLVYLCMNVGPWGLLAVAWPAPFVPQSGTSLGLTTALLRVLSALAAPLRPSYQFG